MEYYVAYHSASLMGRPYQGGVDFSFFSRKPEKQLQKTVGQSVWVIASQGHRHLRYFLAGVYTPSQIVAEDGGWLIWGKGIPFEPRIEVTELAWFNALRKEQNNFSFGFNRIRSADVVDALERYRVIRSTHSILPEELPESFYSEGIGTRVTVNRYERDTAARAACLKRYGVCCYICKTDLAEIYGEIAARLIHVHHLTPLSAIGREYKIDPAKDLIPICPNCHAVAHRRDPPLSPEEIRGLLSKRE